MTRGVPLLPLLADAGIRMRPVNRVLPRIGSWVGTCPRCGAEDGLWVERSLTTFTTTCGCNERGGLVALFRLLLVPA